MNPAWKERNAEEKRNFIGSIDLEGGDNIGIALASYFEDCTDRPDPDPDHPDLYGWGTWVIEQENAALDKIADAIDREIVE